MFGGHGFYSQDNFFALEAGGRLYMKVDDVNRSDFESAGLKPFVYKSKDRRDMIMSYYEVPPDALDDSAILVEWAVKGIEAAIRSKKEKGGKKKSAKNPGVKKRVGVKKAKKSAPVKKAVKKKNRGV